MEVCGFSGSIKDLCDSFYVRLSQLRVKQTDDIPDTTIRHTFALIHDRSVELDPLILLQPKPVHYSSCAQVCVRSRW
jgi:hypothetical protein